MSRTGAARFEAKLEEERVARSPWNRPPAPVRRLTAEELREQYPDRQKPPTPSARELPPTFRDEARVALLRAERAKERRKAPDKKDIDP